MDPKKPFGGTPFVGFRPARDVEDEKFNQDVLSEISELCDPYQQQNYLPILEGLCSKLNEYFTRFPAKNLSSLSSQSTLLQQVLAAYPQVKKDIESILALYAESKGLIEKGPIVQLMTQFINDRKKVYSEQQSDDFNVLFAKNPTLNKLMKGAIDSMRSQGLFRATKQTPSSSVPKEAVGEKRKREAKPVEPSKKSKIEEKTPTPIKVTDKRKREEEILSSLQQAKTPATISLGIQQYDETKKELTTEASSKIEAKIIDKLLENLYSNQDAADIPIKIAVAESFLENKSGTSHQNKTNELKGVLMLLKERYYLSNHIVLDHEDLQLALPKEMPKKFDASKTQGKLKQLIELIPHSFDNSMYQAYEKRLEKITSKISPADLSSHQEVKKLIDNAKKALAERKTHLSATKQADTPFIHSEKGDGNCLFRSFATYYYQINPNHNAFKTKMFADKREQTSDQPSQYHPFFRKAGIDYLKANKDKTDKEGFPISEIMMTAIDQYNHEARRYEQLSKEAAMNMKQLKEMLPYVEQPAEKKQLETQIKVTESDIKELNMRAQIIEVKKNEPTRTVIDKYLEVSAQDKFWGSSAEMYALAQVFKVDVEVYSKDSKTGQWKTAAGKGARYLPSSPQDKKVGTIYLEYADGNHYNVMINPPKK